MPSAVHLVVSLILCTSGSSEARSLEEHPVTSKRPSRVRDGDEGFVGRNGREKYFLNEIDMPFRQTNDFFTKREQKQN